MEQREINHCPECGVEREDFEHVCSACGAPPRSGGDLESSVRTTDLEPYIALRYIARLFKVLAVLLLIMMIGEIVTGLTMQGTEVLFTLLSEAASLMVLAGMLWGAGDIAILLIDLGHDIRVSRILLGRINSQFHESPTPEQVDQVRRKGDALE
ncbi:MAG: zinc ribbon domain-containing protein [Thermoanaerobaculia bacterium]|nr:zinc ribbon domain-containing protein [Thermoanaerobaculia bacterium]